MKFLVPIKRVIDYAVKVRLASATSIDTTAKHSMNPFDEIAIEEALTLKTSQDQVIAITIGPKESQETLRTALAMGADRAIHIPYSTPNNLNLQPLDVAHILKAIVCKESTDIVIMGKQSIDDDCSQTGPMLAGLLGWPQATFAYKVKLIDDMVQVTREVDGGLQTIKAKPPIVITTDLRLNQPRYATLPNIMKAKKKTIEVLELSSLGVNVNPRVKYVQLYEPEKRKAGRLVADVDELIQVLKPHIQ